MDERDRAVGSNPTSSVKPFRGTSVSTKTTTRYSRWSVERHCNRLDIEFLLDFHLSDLKLRLAQQVLAGQYHAHFHLPSQVGRIHGRNPLVTAQRYMGTQGIPTPWLIQLDAYQEAGGMRIPTTFEVTWHPASGAFTWFRGQLTEIEYNESGNVIRFDLT